jgi:hypothetical protein
MYPLDRLKGVLMLCIITDLILGSRLGETFQNLPDEILVDSLIGPEWPDAMVVEFA